MDSFGYAKPSSDSYGFAWVHSGAPRSRRIHSGSRGFTQAGYGSSGSFGFAWDRAFARGYSRARIADVGFIVVRECSFWLTRVHSGEPRASLGVARFIRVPVGSHKRSLESPGLFRFAWVQPRVRRVH